MAIEEDIGSNEQNDLEAGDLGSLNSYVEFLKEDTTPIPSPKNKNEGGPSSKAWDEEVEEKEKAEKGEGEGDSQETWSLGRLEEYKALKSSITWMKFDMGVNLQDVSLKCAGRGLVTFVDHFTTIGRINIL